MTTVASESHLVNKNSNQARKTKISSVQNSPTSSPEQRYKIRTRSVSTSSIINVEPTSKSALIKQTSTNDKKTNTKTKTAGNTPLASPSRWATSLASPPPSSLPVPSFIGNQNGSRSPSPDSSQSAPTNLGKPVIRLHTKPSQQGMGNSTKKNKKNDVVNGNSIVKEDARTFQGNQRKSARAKLEFDPVSVSPKKTAKHPPGIINEQNVVHQDNKRKGLTRSAESLTTKSETSNPEIKTNKSVAVKSSEPSRMVSVNVPNPPPSTPPYGSPDRRSGSSTTPIPYHRPPVDQYLGPSSPIFIDNQFLMPQPLMGSPHSGFMPFPPPNGYMFGNGFPPNMMMGMTPPRHPAAVGLGMNGGCQDLNQMSNDIKKALNINGGALTGNAC
eukprot:TRINITY_DN2764_c0_g3_i2.p1 TRINITY_DN2764_c0_g3~~TRINITY_DN2764_c0_g3_i2.p1  ORF type:complete len:385 (-),score=92.95 TRINITY_DN2764_c0_g3_i2:91-1245(-)